MLRQSIIFTAAALAATPALAHGGHVAEAAGHDHWLALAAVSAAAVLLAIVLRDELKTRRKKASLSAKRRKV